MIKLRNGWFAFYYSLFIVLSVLPSAPAHADIYAYTDDMDITHYSDIQTDVQYTRILSTGASAIAEKASTVGTNTDSGLNSDSDTDASTLRLTDNKVFTISPQLLAQINQSAQTNQIESELIHAVMHVESAYQAQAQSHKGAIGLMQLMPQTAKRFGVNNSNDSAQNIEGGARYLRTLLTLFNNDLSLTLAAYNAGEQAVIRYGNTIPPYKETQTYVPKVLGIYKALIKQKEQKQNEQKQTGQQQIELMPIQPKQAEPRQTELKQVELNKQVM